MDVQCARGYRKLDVHEIQVRFTQRESDIECDKERNRFMQMHILCMLKLHLMT